MKSTPKYIGLTGGIGVGKTALALCFEKLGVPCLDADDLARKLREPGGAAEPLILKRFGTTDRNELRKKISTDPAAKKDLESILHPLIRKESERELQKLAQQNPQAPFILYEATLLVEAGRLPDFKGLIIVTAPIQDRIQRIMTRDHCSEEQAKKMIQAQSTDEARLAMIKNPISIISVENKGNQTDLEQKARKALDQLNQS